MNQTALIELHVHLCEFDYSAHAQCMQHVRKTPFLAIICCTNTLSHIQYLIDAENASIEKKNCNFSNLRFNIEIVQMRCN